jgi:hypothetical protein
MRIAAANEVPRASAWNVDCRRHSSMTQSYQVRQHEYARIFDLRPSAGHTFASKREGARLCCPRCDARLTGQTARPSDRMRPAPTVPGGAQH